MSAGCKEPSVSLGLPGASLWPPFSQTEQVGPTITVLEDICGRRLFAGFIFAAVGGSRLPGLLLGVVDVVSVLLWPLKHLLRWQHLSPGPCLPLGLLGPVVVQAVMVRLRAPPGAWDTAQGVLGLCQGLGT